jgi:hypothetical protein
MQCIFNAASPRFGLSAALGDAPEVEVALV